MATNIAVNALVAEPMKNGVFGVAGVLRSLLHRFGLIPLVVQATRFLTRPRNEFAPDSEPAWRRLCANRTRRFRSNPETLLLTGQDSRSVTIRVSTRLPLARKLLKRNVMGERQRDRAGVCGNLSQTRSQVALRNRRNDLCLEKLLDVTPVNVDISRQLRPRLTQFFGRAAHCPWHTAAWPGFTRVEMIVHVHEPRNQDLPGEVYKPCTGDVGFRRPARWRRSDRLG